MLEKLTIESFAQHLNTRFRVAAEGSQPIELELVQADDLGSSEEHETFSLVFRGPLKGSFLPQGIYTFEHEGLSTFNLFVVPIGPDAEGMRYEAIFNRRKIKS